MSDEIEKNKAPRDRSPGFPCISLRTAIDRLMDFEKEFGRHQIPVSKIGTAWGLKGGGSQVGSLLAALKYFGLLQYEGSADARKASVTEDARTYLRAQQEGVKLMLLKRFALNPKEIAKFWEKWGVDRPPDVVCEDTLVLENSYSQKAAPLFLKVYDETIEFAGLKENEQEAANNETSIDDSVAEDDQQSRFQSEQIVEQGIQSKKTVKLQAGERELTTGLLSKEASFRLLVSGRVGSKEIDRLIKKLELDKEILGEKDDDFSDLV